MKNLKSAILLLTLCIISTASFAQQQQPSPGSPEQLMYPMQHKTALLISPQPVVLVEGQETRSNSLILDGNNIGEMKIYKGEEATAKFGNKAEHGIIILNLKEKVDLVGVNEVYNHFNVPQEQRNLKISIDNKPANPTHLLADLKQIEKIEVVKEDITATFRRSWNEDEPYLNIVTKK